MSVPKMTAQNAKVSKTSALTAAAAGEHVGKLYQQVTADLPLEDRKIVQRRFKEILTKGSILYGVPRAAVAFSSLYSVLPEAEIDTYSPRYVDDMLAHSLLTNSFQYPVRRGYVR